MYILELIYKLITDFKSKKTKKPKREETEETNPYPVCEHIFLPVDSTKKVLACTKCGVIRKIP